MTAVIIDASVALCWLLNEKAPAEIMKLAQLVGRGTAVEAPVLLRYEVSNVLVVSHTRRDRLSSQGLLSALQDFDNLPIRYDHDSPQFAPTVISQIAQNQNLTVYDAAYLELALRKGRVLATNDDKMKVAATKLGISLL
jgi:predicted nucleic acid-binding protein